MSEIKFNIPKKTDKDLYDLVEDHPGFPSRSAFIRHYLKLGLSTIKTNKAQEKPSREKKDDISKCMKIIEDLFRGKINERIIVGNLHSGKLVPELVVYITFIIESIRTTFQKTREIKNVVEYVSKHILTKKDALSKIRYKQIMDRCPSMITKSIKQVEVSPTTPLQKTQSKIYQYPKPPLLSSTIDYEDEELEEIPITGNQDTDQTEEESELMV